MGGTCSSLHDPYNDVLYTDILSMLTYNFIFTYQLASTMLNEKQKDGLGSANDGFYESKREWLGRRHFILAFERYVSLFLFSVRVSLI